MTGGVVFTPDLLERPAHSGIDVVTTLRHFAIVTYPVEPDALKQHLHPRFVPDCVETASGRTVGLVSVVPFFDVDFCAATFPSPRLRSARRTTGHTFTIPNLAVVLYGSSVHASVLGL